MMTQQIFKAQSHHRPRPAWHYSKSLGWDRQTTGHVMRFRPHLRRYNIWPQNKSSSGRVCVRVRMCACVHVLFTHRGGGPTFSFNTDQCRTRHGDVDLWPRLASKSARWETSLGMTGVQLMGLVSNLASQQTSVRRFELIRHMIWF